MRAWRDAGQAPFAAHVQYGQEIMLEAWAEVLAVV
jgi:hypothetical protein